VFLTENISQCLAETIADSKMTEPQWL